MRKRLLDVYNYLLFYTLLFHHVDKYFHMKIHISMKYDNFIFVLREIVYLSGNITQGRSLFISQSHDKVYVSIFITFLIKIITELLRHASWCFIISFHQSHWSDECVAIRGVIGRWLARNEDLEMKINFRDIWTP